MVTIKAKGGDTVGKGNYWNFENGERTSMDGLGVLPGGKEISYYRIHPALLVVLAPILGLVYAVFLPAIGLVMAISAVTGRILGSVAETFSMASVFTWRPTEAYLAGKKRSKGGKAKTKSGNSSEEERK